VILTDLVRLIKNPPIEYRPERRWWLAEGIHTDETLRYEIDIAHRLGFGGMEFLAMDEEAIDHIRYGWGSEEWVHDSQIVVEETTRRNMSVSFTSGTNWSNANLPTIDADHPAAAQELNVVSEELDDGASRTGALPRIDLQAGRKTIIPGERGVITEQTLVGVVAARVVEEREVSTVLEVESVVDLTDRVQNGALDWQAAAPPASWPVLAWLASPPAKCPHTDDLAPARDCGQSRSGPGPRCAIPCS
jgi:hypothetical protein